MRSPDWCVIFDIDGVLMDTRQIVKESYEAVGVDMPGFAWGKPWQSWLPKMFDDDLDKATLAHSRKTRVYLEKLRGLQFKSPAAAAQTIRRDGLGVVKFATGASARPAIEIVRRLGFDLDDILGASMGSEAKQDVVRECTNKYTKVVYIDDMKDLGEKIVQGTGASFVWYHTQDADELLEDIWTR